MFKGRLQDELAARKLAMNALSRMSGVGYATIRDILTKTPAPNPTLGTVQAIADALEMHPLELLRARRQENTTGRSIRDDISFSEEQPDRIRRAKR